MDFLEGWNVGLLECCINRMMEWLEGVDIGMNGKFNFGIGV